MTRILPSHEQHYPSKLLTHRLQEYVLDSGPPTFDRSKKISVTGRQVVDMVIAAQGASGLIDPRYFVGTCFHEAGCSNEWDTEIATQSSPLGFVSVGAYQIGEEEAHRFGYTLEDMLDFVKSTTCMIKLAEANLERLHADVIASPCTSSLDYTDPHGIVWKDGGLRAYLSIAHNHGNGYAAKTIARYGMNWAAYKSRNPTDNIVAHGYGEDCVTGGAYYPK